MKKKEVLEIIKRVKAENFPCTPVSSDYNQGWHDAIKSIETKIREELK